MGFRRYRYHWVLLFYCVVDLCAFAYLSPYDAIGPELLVNPDFQGRLEGWKLQGDLHRVRLQDGMLEIDHGAEPALTVLSQCQAAQRLPSRLALTAKAKCRGVVRGEAVWHEARIELVGYDSRNEGDYEVTTRLLGLQGEEAWVGEARVYRNTLKYRRICVEVSLYRASGRFWIKGLSLRQAQESRLYRWVSLSLLGGWVVLGAWLARGLFGHYRGRPLAGYLIALLGVLLMGILMPQELRSGLERQILSWLAHLGLSIASDGPFSQVGRFDLWPRHWDLSKFSHLAGFTLLAGLLSVDPRDTRVARLCGLLLLAVATELLQFYVPERTPRFSDVMVDSLGISLGWVLGRLWYHMRGYPNVSR